MNEILLTKGKLALVDDADYLAVSQFKWYAKPDRSGRWYAARKVRLGNKRVHQYMARFIMGIPNGDPREVDHKNREQTLDNRRENLRITLNRNNQNKGMQKNNTSGVIGVCWHKRTGRWIAKIQVNHQRIHLGYFASKQLAKEARDAAALRYHREFAITNDMLATAA